MVTLYIYVCQGASQGASQSPMPVNCNPVRKPDLHRPGCQNQHLRGCPVQSKHRRPAHPVPGNTRHGYCIAASSPAQPPFLALKELRSSLKRLRHCALLLPGTTPAIRPHRSSTSLLYCFSALTSASSCSSLHASPLAGAAAGAESAAAGVGAAAGCACGAGLGAAAAGLALGGAAGATAAAAAAPLGARLCAAAPVKSCA